MIRGKRFFKKWFWGCKVAATDDVGQTGKKTNRTDTKANFEKLAKER